MQCIRVSGAARDSTIIRVLYRRRPTGDRLIIPDKVLGLKGLHVFTI